MERNEVIEHLQQLKCDYTNYWEETHDEMTDALEYAISSLKTDEMYQLDYEGVQNIVVTDGMTNGDVIKQMFPDYIYVGTCVLDKNENILLHDVNYKWWNSPYKGGKRWERY